MAAIATGTRDAFSKACPPLTAGVYGAYSAAF